MSGLNLTPRMPFALVLLLLALLAAPRAAAAEFDLSKLPAHKPEARVHGIIRIWGHDVLELVHAWEEAFKKLHYESRFDDYLLATPVAFSGLVAGNADIGYMGHSWWRSDLKGFEAVYGYPPLEIKFAQGSFNEPKGSTPSPVFFVHKDNPLTGLTLEQLDGIFGAERTGGWKGTKWTTDAAGLRRRWTCNSSKPSTTIAMQSRSVSRRSWTRPSSTFVCFRSRRTPAHPT